MLRLCVARHTHSHRYYFFFHFIYYRDECAVRGAKHRTKKMGENDKFCILYVHFQFRKL